MIKVLKIFYSFVTKKKLLFLLVLTIIVLSSIVNSITPYFYKIFVDEIPSFNYQHLIYILLIYTGVRMLGTYLNALSFGIGDLILKESAADARISVFKHIQDLDLAFHVNKSTGSLISIFKRGDGAFFNFYHHIHFRILDIVVSFFVMLFFFTKLDPWIGVITVCSFLVSLIAARFVISFNIKTREKFNDEEDRVSAILVDNMINFETVKLFSKEYWELNRLKKAFEVWKEKLWTHGLSFRAFDISLGTIIDISVFLSLYAALKFAVNKSMSLGDFVLIIGFINFFYPKVFELVWGFREIAKSYADIQKYFGIFNYEVEVKDPEKPLRPSNISGEIIFKNISFSYKDGQKNALHNFDLKIKDGESVAFVGRSGSGKTTLIKLLMRFYDPEKGQVLIGGIDIRKITKSDLRSYMGVVPQEPILFDNTIAYNIGYGDPTASQKGIRAAAKIANIDSFIESLPKKYNTNVGERGIKLSGGQKQRLAIARMVLSNPKIIIFDEATSQLDSESESLIQEALWKSSKNKTTLIIAHRLSTVMRADKIIVMEKGKIVESGSHKLLLNQKNSLYSHFWDLQINL